MAESEWWRSVGTYHTFVKFKCILFFMVGQRYPYLSTLCTSAGPLVTAYTFINWKTQVASFSSSLRRRKKPISYSTSYQSMKCVALLLSLKETLNWNLIVQLSSQLSELTKTTLYLEPTSLNEPSTKIIQAGSLIGSIATFILGLLVNSSIKSAMACPLMEVLDLQIISNSLYSTSYFISLPEVLT